MLKHIGKREAIALLVAGAVVGLLLVAAQAPVWTVYVSVAVAAIVYAVLNARRWRSDYRPREDDPNPTGPHPERAPLASR